MTIIRNCQSELEINGTNKRRILICYFEPERRNLGLEVQLFPVCVELGTNQGKKTVWIVWWLNLIQFALFNKYENSEKCKRLKADTILTA